MKWVKLATAKLSDRKIAHLPDSLWRLLMEYDLLCGRNNGPVNADWVDIAWLLHHEPEEIESGSLKLLEEGLLEMSEDGRVCPTGWLDVNASYLGRLAYNRDRYHAEKGEEMEADEETERLWAALPGNGGRPVDPNKAVADPFSHMIAAAGINRVWQAWAAEQTIIKKAPETVQQVSWLLYDKAGIVPFGSRKAWAASIYELITASGDNFECLENAIRIAVEHRDTRGITLGGPRSFLNYARNEQSKRRKAAKQAPLSYELDAVDAEPMGEIDL